MESTNRSYLIVGAGVFGVSTAYHLIKKYPNASVTLVDRDAFDAESRVAASWDWNKVIRADYDDIVYCKLALEAQDILESDPLWQPYFHQTGIYWTCRSEYAQEVVDNYQRLGRKADIKAVPVSEAKKLYNGIFEDADYTDVQNVLVNKSSGWVAADDCLRAITRDAIRLGVEYVTAEVATLQLDKTGRCIGLQTLTGQILTASHVVLCTGAYTTKLLELSAKTTGLTNLRGEGRIVAGGITTGVTKLDERSYNRFAKMPVGVQGYNTKSGPFIGSLPPTEEKQLKWWGQTIFKNDYEVLPGRIVSAPPPERDYKQWEVSTQLKEDITFASNVFYGERAATWKLDKHRICWDAFTTSSDFIISPHAASQGLYVATCGSFHGWKFFPILGKYIVQMLENSLSPALMEKWAWDRERPDPALNPDYPRWEMKDFFESNLRL